MSQATVLVVDDDPDMRALIGMAISEAGHRVIEAPNGDDAVAKISAFAPDLVLLDIGLGADSIDGLEVCRRVRRNSSVPIVFLTTRADEIDQLMGLTVGADDYLAKPISSRLLVARVDAVLRRGSRAEAATLLKVDALEIDLDSRLVRLDDSEIELTRTQFDLLAALAENPARVLTREQLVERVWGDWYGADHHLDVHLSRLRNKLLEAGGPRVAHAVRGVGFKLKA